jgi:predicted MPP superfamily phosphohydrolase
MIFGSKVNLFSVKIVKLTFTQISKISHLFEKKTLSVVNIFAVHFRLFLTFLLTKLSKFSSHLLAKNFQNFLSITNYFTPFQQKIFEKFLSITNTCEQLTENKPQLSSK